MTMRERILQKLKGFLEDDCEIPRRFDCFVSEYITEYSELETMDDEELLEVFEATIDYRG